MAKPEDDPADSDAEPAGDRTALADFRRLIDDIDAAAPSVKGDAWRLDDVLGLPAEDGLPAAPRDYTTLAGYPEPAAKIRHPFSPPTTKNQRIRRPTLSGAPTPATTNDAGLTSSELAAARLGAGDDGGMPFGASPDAAPAPAHALPPLPPLPTVTSVTQVTRVGRVVPPLARNPGLPPTAPDTAIVAPQPASVPPRDGASSPGEQRVQVRAAGLRRRDSSPAAAPPPPPEPPRVPATRPLSRPSVRPDAILAARAALQATKAPPARPAGQPSDPALKAAPTPSEPRIASGGLVHVRRTTDPRIPRITGPEGNPRVSAAALAAGPDAPLGPGAAAGAHPGPLTVPKPTVASLAGAVGPGGGPVGMDSGSPTVSEPVPESLLEALPYLRPDVRLPQRRSQVAPPATRFLDGLTLAVLVLLFETMALPTAAGPPWELLVRPMDPSFVGAAALILVGVVYFLPLRAKARAISNTLAALLLLPIGFALVALAVARDTFDGQPGLAALFAGSLVPAIALLAGFVLLPAGLLARAHAPRTWAPTVLLGLGVCALVLGLLGPGLGDQTPAALLLGSLGGAAALGDQVAAIATLPALACALLALYCAIPGRGARLAGPLAVILWAALSAPFAVLALFVASGDTWTLVLEPFKLATLIAALALYGAIAITQLVRLGSGRART